MPALTSRMPTLGSMKLLPKVMCCICFRQLLASKLELAPTSWAFPYFKWVFVLNYQFPVPAPNSSKLMFWLILGMVNLIKRDLHWCFMKCQCTSVWQVVYSTAAASSMAVTIHVQVLIVVMYYLETFFFLFPIKHDAYKSFWKILLIPCILHYLMSPVLCFPSFPNRLLRKSINMYIKFF